MLTLLLACATDELDSGTAPHTSDTVIEIVGTPVNECTDGKLHLQIGFSVQVPRVEAEVKTGPDGGEFHDVPYGGLDEDTESIHLYDNELNTEASTVDVNNTAYACADSPVAGYRVYDEDDGLMACYFGEFVADWYDATACPE